MAAHVAFRADASASMGAGHVSRCTTLAGALKRRGCRITFVCAVGSTRYFPEVLGIADAVIELPHDPGEPGSWLTVPPDVDADATIAAVSDAEPDWLIVDHYGIDRTWERAVRQHVPHLMVIDDLADRPHDCDLLLDQNLRRAGAADYRALVPPDASVLQGPRFALLREEFVRARPQRIRTHIARVLVSFGGVDAANGTGKAIAALTQVDAPIAVDVVIGAHHPARAAIVDACARAGHSCHVQTTEIADLMAAADLAIGASGASSWERCVVGLPTIALIMAENQRMIADELAHRGAAINLGDHDSVRAGDIASAIMRLRTRPDELSSMSKAAYAIMADRVDVAEVLLDRI